MQIVQTTDNWLSKEAVFKHLSELAENTYTDRTVYLAANFKESKSVTPKIAGPVIEAVINEVGSNDTGMVIFRRDEELTVIEPPLPFTMDAIMQDQDTLLLEDIFDVPKTVAVVLVRLGRYAVALMDGQKLVDTKTEGRQMKNRHKAGGSSQRRFERSRERLIRELYDKVCEVSQRIFEPRISDIDYLFLGGEKHTVNGFKKRCGFIEKFDGKVMSRLINIDEPNSEALRSLGDEIYKSRVRVFKTVQ